MYDLVLRGGTVLDPSQDLHKRLDVGVRDGRIAALTPDIPASEARRVVEVRGRTVVPGLIDLHAHVYASVWADAEDPDTAGVRSGVTTLVDAGSAGSDTVLGFTRFVVAPAKTRILAFLNICHHGLIRLPEVRHVSDVDAPGTLARLQQMPDFLIGVKLRFVGPIIEAMGSGAVKVAQETAKSAGRKLMVHIGDPDMPHNPRLAAEALDLLQPGDILTHLYTPHPGRCLDADGKVLPEVRRARERGVTLDPAWGRRNFGVETARRLLDADIRPDTISTDITAVGRRDHGLSLTGAMSRFMAIGFSLEDVVRMTTVNPAKALNMQDRLGSLAVGREADITVLDVMAGRWEYVDVIGARFSGDRAVLPVVTVRAGEVFTPDWGPYSWGWLPVPGPSALEGSTALSGSILQPQNRAQQIGRFLRGSQGKPFCDIDVAKEFGLPGQADVNLALRKLSETPDFVRRVGTCSRCGQVRLTTAAR